MLSDVLRTDRRSMAAGPLSHGRVSFCARRWMGLDGGLNCPASRAALSCAWRSDGKDSSAPGIFRWQSRAQRMQGRPSRKRTFLELARDDEGSRLKRLRRRDAFPWWGRVNKDKARTRPRRATSSAGLLVLDLDSDRDRTMGRCASTRGLGSCGRYGYGVVD